MRSTNLFIVRGYTGSDAKGFDGGKVAKISICTNRTVTDRSSGERKEVADWVTITILNPKAAAWAIENVKKGDPVYAECRIAEGSYKKGGETIYTTDIIANTFDRLAPKPEGDDY